MAPVVGSPGRDAGRRRAWSDGRGREVVHEVLLAGGAPPYPAEPVAGYLRSAPEHLLFAREGAETLDLRAAGVRGLALRDATTVEESYGQRFAVECRDARGTEVLVLCPDDEDEVADALGVPVDGTARTTDGDGDAAEPSAFAAALPPRPPRVRELWRTAVMCVGAPLASTSLAGWAAPRLEGLGLVPAVARTGPVVLVCLVTVAFAVSDVMAWRQARAAARTRTPVAPS